MIQLTRQAIAAAEKKIGMIELARRLKAPETTVRAWREGHGAMPQSKFALLIEVMAAVHPYWNPEQPGQGD